MLVDLVWTHKPSQGKLVPMSIHSTIQQAREAKGWSMERLAEEVSRAEGLEKTLAWQTVQQWEKEGGTAPKRKRLAAVAKVLGLDQSQLAFGTATHDAAKDEDFIAIRRADVKFSNGSGSVTYYEDDKPPLSFRVDFLRKLGIPAGKAVVVDANGVSNEPKIADGSVVLVNTADREHLKGQFFAFRVDGELMIKRLETLEGIGVLATAENSNFSPKSRIYREGIDDWEVIGRAVWTGTML